MARQDGAEALALLIGHDHVGRAVGLEIAVDGDDVGVTEGDEGRGLLTEARQSPVEIALLGRADRMDSHLVGVAHDDAARQELLDRDRAVEGDLGRPVGHAEAARPEHAVDAVALELIAFRQGVAPFPRHPCPLEPGPAPGIDRTVSP